MRGSQPGERRGGRSRGTPNKLTKALRDAILLAAEKAGGEGGLVGYLTLQAHENPRAFLCLLGKVLPLQVAGDESAPLVHTIKRVIVYPKNPDSAGA